MDIGGNIKKFRELKDITREAIASDLGMSVSNYSKIERGEIDLTLSRIEKIAQILGVDLSQILNFDTSQIFNVAHIDLSQGLGAKAENMYFNTADEYKEKYIKLLEAENERLKSLVKE
ncbi:helix-turn-helix domain-containing protein [Flavobacterium piscisymbiosum]|uniref:Helix-turn-helix domain-containing protein n=1 Tax=Flavobacterium piscisymbiosum TaxID=2893753 RepID=A0ABS8MIH1_9FLAO|nr:helix-turn-helix transcriptional regulator [Flavobacterium sp. F-30]MCC9065294.1 helix-turn-helix domain-containing protein [Flavobacterium sp. F-30]